jgi:hypothetical protein
MISWYEVMEMYEEYMEHFTDELSDEIKKYAIDVALIDSRYIFIRREGKQQYGYCTHCHIELQTVGLLHNDIVECPNCKSTCKVKSSARGRKYMLDEVYFTYYEKSPKDPNVITARGVYATRNYRGDYHNVKTNYFIDALYVFEMGKSVMFKSVYYREDHYVKRKIISSLTSYWESKSYIKNVCYSRGSIREAVEGTPFQYSTWENYNHKDMVEFFDLYSKYPSIEYLTKERYSNLVNEKLLGYPTHRAINWRGKNIFKVLKINKQDLREFKSNDICVDFDFLMVFQDAKKYKWNLKLSELVELNIHYSRCYDSFLELLKISSAKKILYYFSKQYTRYNNANGNKHYYGLSQVLGTYKDYIADCKKLNMDIRNERVLFPKNLYTAHHNTIKQVKIKADAELDAKIGDRAKSLEKYCMESYGLMIRPAMSTSDLVEESKALSHCVAANYTKPYSEGTTNIFFIRKVSDPDKPYFTLELKKDVIIQTRGKNNCSPGKDVERFIEAFTMKKLNKRRLKNRVLVTA